MTFRQWLALGLRSWAESLDPTPPPVAPDLGPLVAVAVPLVQAQAAYADRSGEARRHQVYAALIDRFPGVPRRQLSVAIEEALVVSESLLP